MENSEKVKLAFSAVKKDIENLKSLLSQVEQTQQKTHSELTNHKDKTIEHIDSASLSIRKDINKELDHIQDSIYALSSKENRNTAHLKKQISKTQETILYKEKSLLKEIESIDKDILTLQENHQTLYKKELNNVSLIGKNKSEIKKVKQILSKQHSEAIKVVELKNKLKQRISDIETLTQEMPSMKKELQDALIAVDDKYSQSIDTISKEHEILFKDLEERLVKNVNTISELKETISTVHNQLKETTTAVKAELLSQTEQKDIEIKHLQDAVSKQNDLIKQLEKKIEKVEQSKIQKIKSDIEKKITSIERKLDKKVAKSVKPVSKNDTKKRTKKTEPSAVAKSKEFLYNLFFEEIEESQQEKKESSKKSQSKDEKTKVEAKP